MNTFTGTPVPCRTRVPFAVMEPVTPLVVSVVPPLIVPVNVASAMLPSTNPVICSPSVQPERLVSAAAADVNAAPLVFEIVQKLVAPPQRVLGGYSKPGKNENADVLRRY